MISCRFCDPAAFSSGVGSNQPAPCALVGYQGGDPTSAAQTLTGQGSEIRTFAGNGEMEKNVIIALSPLTPKTLKSVDACNRRTLGILTLNGFIQSGRMMWRRECASAIRTRMLRHQRIQQAVEPTHHQTIERFQCLKVRRGGL